VGTTVDNTLDRNLKGRQAKGERQWKAKLTEKQVRYILSQYTPWSRTKGLAALSRKFKVHRTTIQIIVQRRSWKHVNIEEAV
jgi:hypothetical protein